MLAGDRGGGDSEVEVVASNAFWCGVLVLWGQKVHRYSGTCSTLTFKWGWLTSASALCRQPSCPLNSQGVPSCCPPLPPQLAPVLCSLLCPISSSVLLSVDDLWIFSPSFPGLQEQRLGGEGTAKTILVPSLPPTIATLKEAAGLAGILRRILPFHFFGALFLFFSELQDTKAGEKKTHTHRQTHSHRNSCK